MTMPLRLFEFGDMKWCPEVIRRTITQMLLVISKQTGLFRCTAGLVRKYLGKRRDILVLAAGSGGGILDVMGRLPRDVDVLLTDLEPDLAFVSDDKRVHYKKKPVDALDDLGRYPGLRVMYDSFHHLDREQAAELLQSVVKSNEPFLTFEASDRSPAGIWACVMAPIYVFRFLPKLSPLKFSQIFFTYVLPLIPFVMLWDGLVSCLRVYSVKDLRDMTKDLTSYEWKIGRLKGQLGEPIRYLAGVPKT